VCGEMDSPELQWFYRYNWDDLPLVAEGLTGVLKEAAEGCEVMVTWGERCWYNVVASRVAAELGVRHVRLERAAFPGMLLVDGDGLDYGTSEITERYRNHTLSGCELSALQEWAAIASAQTIECQGASPMSRLLELVGDQKFVLVPLQVPFDTNMVFRTVGEVTTNLELVDYAVEHYGSDHTILVKQHPADQFSYQERLFWECHKRGATLVDHGLSDLLDGTEKIVSMSSQVVIDGALRGVPFELVGSPGFWPKVGHVDVKRWLHTLRFEYFISPIRFTGRLRDLCQT